MKKIVEFRSYNLKPDSRDTFHQLVLNRSLPLMKQWGIDVIAFGPSLHDESSYYLIRCYDNLNHRQVSQDSFYGSEDWKLGPREQIVSLIESDTTIVVELDKESIDSLRKINDSATEQVPPTKKKAGGQADPA